MVYRELARIESLRVTLYLFLILIFGMDQNSIQQPALVLGTRRVTTGYNREDGHSLFCRFLAAAPTYRYAFRLTCSRCVRLHQALSVTSLSAWFRSCASHKPGAAALAGSLCLHVLRSVAQIAKQKSIDPCHHCVSLEALPLEFWFLA